MLVRLRTESFDNEFHVGLRDVPTLLVAVEASESVILELTHELVVQIELVGSHLPVRVKRHCGSHPSAVSRVVAPSAEESEIAQSVRSSPATGNDVVNVERCLVQRNSTVHTPLTIADEHRLSGGFPVFRVVHGLSVSTTSRRDASQGFYRPCIPFPAALPIMPTRA